MSQVGGENQGRLKARALGAAAQGTKLGGRAIIKVGHREKVKEDSTIDAKAPNLEAKSAEGAPYFPDKTVVVPGTTNG